jgi:hypothetical protein
VTLQLLSFCTLNRKCVDDTTRHFLQMFCGKLKKSQKNYGRTNSKHTLLGRTNQLFCIANFLHPYYKGHTLKLNESTGRVYDDTLSNIKDMFKKLRLDKEESPSQHPVPCQVSIKILSFFSKGNRLIHTLAYIVDQPLKHYVICSFHSSTF